jgi:hypothetical protein
VPKKRIHEDLNLLRATHRHASNPFLFRPATKEEIDFHFNNLKAIARRHAPQVFPKVHHLHCICLDHHDHKISTQEALRRIENVVRSGGRVNQLNSRELFPFNPIRSRNVSPLLQEFLPHQRRTVQPRSRRVEPLRFRKTKKARSVFGMPLPEWF